jgi:recombination protein RecT
MSNINSLKNKVMNPNSTNTPSKGLTKTSIDSLVKNTSVKQRFEDVLGKRANAFISSLISAAQTNPRLKECDPTTILSSGMLAATLDLPINQNLGFAYIVPYKSKGVFNAQFQMGYKGFVQLAIRSGQYKTINVSEVYEGEIESFNRMTGEFKFESLENTQGKAIVGYIAYFRLINGFEKAVYMTKAQVDTHAKKYSQTYKMGFGLWKDDFDAMAKKTVLKLLLGKYGILSVEMQKAVQADQAVIRKDEAYEYIDNDSDINIAKADKVVDAQEPESKQAEGGKKDDEFKLETNKTND